MPVSGSAARRVFLIPNFLPRLTSLAGERSPVFLTAQRGSVRLLSAAFKPFPHKSLCVL